LERKIVSGIMLTLLLIGMLTLAFNIQLVKADANVTSRWLSFSVTFDGKMTTAEEWSDTTPVDITLLEWHVGPGTVSARVWIKNDGTWLYMLYRVEWLAGDIDPFDGGYIEYFWDWEPLGWNHSDFSFIEFDNVTRDYYGWNGTGWYNDVLASPPGENNVEGAATHDGTYYWFEFRKELDSGDGYDWSFNPGQVIRTNLLVGIWDDSTRTPYETYISLYISTPTPRVVHNVDTGLDYAWIQEAIDAPETLDGHTILVEAGIYYENVFLYKSLRLIGENAETTIVDGGGSWHVIDVSADNVAISGFTFQHGWGGISLLYSSGNTITNNLITLNEWSGIEQYHSNDNIIHDNKVTLNSHAGIWLINSSNNAITYNTVSNNSWQGILLGDSSDNNEVSNNSVIENGNTGIFIINSSENSVSCNNATLSVYCGIQLDHSENSNVKKNVVTLNSIGIMQHASKHNVIEDNKVTHNGEGILLAFSNRNIVEANEAVENGGNGIRLYNSSYNEVSHNNASINDTGIVLETSSNNNTLVGNNIASNYNGILLGYSSNNNVIYHNNLLHNTVQIVHVAGLCVNVWDDGYPSGGNYWSDYTGLDFYSGPHQNETGSDGIGDIPYIIDGNNTDRYPLIYPYGYVPSPDLNDDGIVDIFDLRICAKAFGSKPGDINWNPIVDLNQDGLIDIFDLRKIAKHYLEHV